MKWWQKLLGIKPLCLADNIISGFLCELPLGHPTRHTVVFEHAIYTWTSPMELQTNYLKTGNVT